MIFNIRGTSGSGKSTLIRRLIESYPRAIKYKDPNSRRKLLGYVLERPGAPKVAVIGGYENACGGCDTIASYDRIYELVRQSRAMGMVVVYEGLLLSAETRRCIELHNEMGPVTVVALNTPLDMCIASVNERRRAKDPNKPDVNPVNTQLKYKGVLSSMKKLEAAGLQCLTMGREEAFDFLKTTTSLIPTPWGPGVMLSDKMLTTAMGPAMRVGPRTWRLEAHTFTTLDVTPLEAT